MPLLKRRWVTWRGLLQAALWLCLLSVPLLVPHMSTWTLVRMDIPDDTFVLNDFRAVVLFLMDAPLLLGAALLPLYLWRNPEGQRAWLAVGQALTHHRWGVWWIAFLGWAFLSIGWAKSPELALYNSLHLGVELGLAVLVASVVKIGWGRFLLLGLLLAASLHSLVAIAQVIEGGSLGLKALGEFQRSAEDPYGFGPQTIRAYGFSLHPNNLGGYSMIAFLGGLVALQMTLTAPKVNKLLGLGTVGLTLVVALGLVATASRTALLGTALALGIMALAQFWSLKSRRARVGLMGAALLFGICAALLLRLLAWDLVEQLATRMSELTLSRQGVVDRMTYAFRDTIPFIEARPVNGVGIGNLMLNIAHDWGGSSFLLLPAHNVYVYLWAELGVVGLLLVMMALQTHLAYLRLKHGMPLLMITAILAAIAFTWLFDFYFWGDLRSRTMVFWVIGLSWGFRAQSTGELPNDERA